ncbi:hypothetical protein NC652_018241 [Populus alba x Populus x berolinensis]|uniref:Uncharacterized protein n=1 Tax=Populus alba x Populus x berolinensis TaxID=444605 RepID=A0AAD6VZE6_9ROSI|nr:hypothetical protein NC651_016042 [Populus alba x Populus x berolinensis]KAJ6922934.1 hypothetical protein NC652_016554 [Populus alba x Populus x berolinensis]KAJ6922939.1 hypothetical protein NC652_016558 [Populus alba x Populus x berolinensis]KAJ6925237.1 hypothetical protein NC652_018241 [Populus alba x Populus x berolinensis]KAJ6993378.1 hypothetical protein NC653_016493 [Populus alba x Populus x berolinensis]
MPFGREMRSRRRVVGEQTTKPNVTPSPPLPRWRLRQKPCIQMPLSQLTHQHGGSQN